MAPSTRIVGAAIVALASSGGFAGLFAASEPSPTIMPIPVVAKPEALGTKEQADAFAAKQSGSWIYDARTYSLSQKEGPAAVTRALLTAVPLNRSERGLEIISSAEQVLARIDADGAVEISDDVYGPQALSKPPVPQVQAKPEYPFAMRRDGKSGKVTVDFIVEPNGTVAAAWTNAKSPNGFEKNAVKGVLRWKFTPAQLAGEVVATHLSVDIVFNLQDLKK